MITKSCVDSQGDPVILKIYNTPSRRVEEFTPIEPGVVRMYGCGPTVYTYAHIGNLRAYVCQDILRRALGFFGYSVTYVMNITDVGHLTGDVDTGDDKMVVSAREKKKTVWEIAEHYTDAFFVDVEKLNIARPDTVCKATDHIPEMIALVKRLEDQGFTYVAGGNVYFDISKFPRYGDFAGLKLDDLKAGARIEKDPNKRNPLDFVLWFTSSKFGEQAMMWDSPWGRGYPGWHLECSAMSMKYLGEQFDIHAGGIDHVPVHHTNEIAQSEAATGKKWVNYWFHNEFLVMADGKMSKSSGTFTTLSALEAAGYDPLDYRYFLLGAHYRTQLQFSETALAGAQAGRRGLVERISGILRRAEHAQSVESGSDAGEYFTAFTEHIANDLNTSRCLADLWALVKDEAVPPREALGCIERMDSILGLGLLEQARAADAEDRDVTLSSEVEQLIRERNDARRRRDFARADSIRDELLGRGIQLEDGPEGTRWKKSS